MSDVSTTIDPAAQAPALPPVPAPHPLLDSLRAMVGTWHLESRDLTSGAESSATLTREIMDGGYYLVERVDAGTGSPGLQFVGYDPAAGNLRGTYYSSDGPGPFGGIALEYVWEVDGADVTIWCGGVGSPARYTGRFDDARTVLAGRWEWPGGGYEAVETRIG
jgi:hypothetical protein